MADYKMKLIKKILVPSILGIILAFGFTKCADEKETPPPELFSNMPEGGYEIDIEDTFVISPQITYDYDTEYEWSINGQLIDTEKNYQFIPANLDQTTIQFKVLSARGNDSITYIINVLKILRFEELTLKKDTFWNASKDGSEFNSKGIVFPSKYDTIGVWSGFVYSNKSTKKEYKQYTSYTANGADKSKNYIVFHDDDSTTYNRIKFPKGNSYLLKNMQATNTIVAYDYMNPILKYIKYFELSIKGFDSNGEETGEVLYNLSSNGNSINSSWKNVDLEELNYVSEIEFNLKTYSDSAYSIPGYICIDNLAIKDIKTNIQLPL